MSVYSHVNSPKLPRSLFDLSYNIKTSMSLGKLYPIMCDEVVPGDTWKIGNSVVVRFQPLVAPTLHEINAYIHYFFVPYRILSDSNFDWEKFITGFDETNVEFDEVTGDPELQEYDVPLPRWTPTDNGSKSLWDYLGFPVGVNPVGAEPLDFPRRAYNMIWNEYYRDENLMPKVALNNEDILHRCWEKDYFTSALPFQQRGTSPALPLFGTPEIEFLDSTSFDPPKVQQWLADDNATSAPSVSISSSDTTIFTNNSHNADFYPWFAKKVMAAIRRQNNDEAHIKINGVSTANINDFRLAFQIQRWMERNARAGVRYTEFLKAHYSVSPRDERLQRPEYIGGSKSPVIISDVVQNSQTTSGESGSAQGTLAGKGLTATSDYCGHYFATEFGLIMGIMSVMPRSDYMAQGINRQWLRRTKYDFFSPEFQNLSEQAIENAEIFAQSPASGETTQPDNTKIFGFQGRYDELRTKQNLVTGELRSTYDYWHLGRKFENLPKLNADFVKCSPSDRIFAYQESDYDQMIVEVRNICKVIRPLGYMPEPGLIDHV